MLSFRVVLSYVLEYICWASDSEINLRKIFEFRRVGAVEERRKSRAGSGTHVCVEDLLPKCFFDFYHVLLGSKISRCKCGS